MGRLGKTGKAVLVGFILIGMLLLAFIIRRTATDGPTAGAKADAPAETNGISPPALPGPAMRKMLPPKSAGGAMPDENALQAKVASLLKERVEVCGMSPSEAAYYVASDGKIGARPEATAALLAEAAGAIVQSADLRERATGLYIQAYLADSAGSEERELKDRECKTPDCRRALTAAWAETRRNAARPLAELARQTRDPAIYAAAVHSCQKEETGGCIGISYAGWAKLEPENAAPWMMLSEQAKAAGDANGHAEALRHIATASRVDFRLPDMRPLINTDAVTKAPIFAQAELSNWLIGVVAATSISHGSALFSICLRDSSGNLERKSLCDKLASMTLDSERSATGLMLATVLASKLAWPDDKMLALKDERDLIMGLWMADSNPKNPFGCEQITKDVQRSKATLTVGDRAFAKEQLARSGKSMREQVDDYRSRFKFTP